MASHSIAIVTGSNKGIGYAIVENLAQKLPSDKWRIYLTARDECRGKASLDEMHKKGYLHVQFHQLDIDDEASIVKLRDYVKNKYPNGINILVNNAAIAYKVDSTAPFLEQAEVTLKTNFWGTLNVCKHLFPVLAHNARVVHVSSLASQYTFKRLSDQLKETFKNVNTVPELEKLLKKFIEDVKEGNHEAKGWPSSAYGVSKIGVSSLTAIQAKDYKDDPRNLVINCCCPGYVATDMSSFEGHKTIQEGAITPCHLALLPDDHIKGKFFSELQVVDWQQ